MPLCGQRPLRGPSRMNQKRWEEEEKDEEDEEHEGGGRRGGESEEDEETPVRPSQKHRLRSNADRNS